MYTTPILFIVFNRPLETRLVFDQIAKIKPTRLYIASDGPRDSSDIEKCMDVGNIFNAIDWPCDVKKLIQKKNAGCKLAVSSALNWFFEHESEGIILEDDVLPSPSFFSFCEEMLEKYRNNERVGMISGSNLISQELRSSEYFFSEIYSIWGWATWSRVWKSYKVELDDWPDVNKELYLTKQFGSKKLGKYFKKNFDNIKAGLIDTWDHQWAYNCIFNSKLCLTPRVNLVTNIGVIGTHSTQLSENHFVQSGEYLSNNTKFEPVLVVDSDWQNKYVDAKIINEGLMVSSLKSALKKLGIFEIVKSLYKKVKK